ncbi:DnaD domain protein [Alkalihalophilus marmarensis]|uniref:DnaD domain protein n=1 Tax=Alkalihalophilus marmarensis TaxID=521377 RepID=UPI002DB6AE76|nr:DnaD domain protein [Alkalihalophilus marmarensis]MEC2072640.1 DnaD domain protein [Alkalihalophilus marmarensis]
MNYEQQIQAFYNQLETNPLTPSGIATWHALMQVWQKAGWPKSFTVAVSVIAVKSGMKVRHFYNIRKELEEKGYLTFKSRGSGQAAQYAMTAFSTNLHHQPHALYAQDRTQASTQPSAQPYSPLIKENNLKEDTKEMTPFRFYEENGFGRLSPFISESINAWLDDSTFTEPSEVVIEAMKVSLLQNVRTWGYVSKILQDWSGKGLQTVSEIRAEREKWKQKMAAYHAKKKEVSQHEKSMHPSAADYSSYDFGF